MPIDSDLVEVLDIHLKTILEITPEQETIQLNSSPGSVIRIWSDGACTGNPGPGGWGTIIIVDGNIQELSGRSQRTTNNIMEMTGALEGIKRTPEGSSIILTSDSQYLVKGMTQWLKNWKKKGWKKADGNEVLNRDLWMKLDQESQKRNIQWIWIKGHAGHPENERCDELARKAITRR
ncbi:ribonuclease HI [bacterium]|nr:ribonuclease HI [bacterium]